MTDLCCGGRWGLLERYGDSQSPLWAQEAAAPGGGGPGNQPVDRDESSRDEC